MKKTAKILSLVFVLALAAALIFGISAMAADESAAAPKIVSKSAYFGDQTYLYFAVNDSSLADGEELEVLLYTEDPTVKTGAEAFKASPSELVYPYNPDYPVYKSFGIPAKAIGDTIYAVPHVVGTDIDYDAMVKYSVLEYLYELKYTTNQSAAKAELAEALINYADKSQVAFNYKADALASKLHYVYVSVGTLDGVNYSELVAPTATKTVTPVADGITAWAVYKYDEAGKMTKSVVAAGTPITVDATTIIKPSDVYDFEESTNAKDYVASGTGKPIRQNGTWSFLTIAQDAKHGNVLVHNAANNKNSAEVYFDTLTKKAGANTYAFEADMKLDVVNAAGDKLVHFQPYGSFGAAYDIYFQFSEGSNIKIFGQYNDGSTKNESSVTTKAKEGEWFKFRFEYSLTDNDYAPNNGVAKDLYVKIFVNGELVTVGYTPYYAKDTAKHYAADAELFAFFRNSGDTTAVTAYFDNVVTEQLDTEIPEIYTFDDITVYPGVTGGSAVYDEERDSNVLKCENATTSGSKTFNFYNLKSVEGANAIAFEGYVKCDAAAGSQNNFITQIGNTQVQPVFYGYDVEHTSATRGGRLTLASNNPTYASISTKENFIAENEWFRYRVEYINTGAEKATVNIYVNGNKIATGTATLYDISTIAYIQFGITKAPSADNPVTMYFDDVTVEKYIAK
jgi:hypothetical protein